MRLVPQASLASMGARLPRNSDAAKEETSETAAVLAHALGVRWATAAIWGPEKRAYARLPVTAARAAGPPGRRASKAATSGPVEESAQIGESASAKQSSPSAPAKEKPLPPDDWKSPRACMPAAVQ